MSSPESEKPEGAARKLLRTYFTFDARGFAVFRIYLGVVIFGELLRRFPTRYLLFAGDGLFPPPLPNFETPRTHPTLLAFDASHLEVDLFFGFGLVVAALLMLGIATRVVAVLVWLVVVSMVNRTRPVMTGGEMLLLTTTLYAMFAPLAARWSLDARRAHAKGEPVARTLTSGTGFVFVLQWAIMYAVAGLSKNGPSWHEGHAISEALRTCYVAEPLGAALTLSPFMDRALTWSSIVAELALPFLLLSPFRRKHALALAALVIFGLHLGIAVLMRVGVFSYAVWVILPLLAPSELYDAIETRLARRPVSLAHARSPRPVAALRVVFVLLALGSFIEYGTFRLSIATRGFYVRSEHLDALLKPFGITQHWTMFAPNPPRTSDVLVVSARTVDGRDVDPLRHAWSGVDAVRHAVPGYIDPNHIAGVYLSRSYPFDPLERSRLDGLTRLVRTHHERTGRAADRVVSYRVTRLFTPTQTPYRRDPRPVARRLLRSLLGEARAHVVPFASVHGRHVHQAARAGDGGIAPRNTDARSPLGAAFDSRCGELRFVLAREARVTTLLLSASDTASYEIRVGEGPPLRVFSRAEDTGHFRTHVLYAGGVRADRITVRATGGANVASVSELVVIEGSTPGLGMRVRNEPRAPGKPYGLPAEPHYEPLIFGPAVGTYCAGALTEIPTMLAADTALTR